MKKLTIANDLERSPQVELWLNTKKNQNNLSLKTPYFYLYYIFADRLSTIKQAIATQTRL
jgi:hypothetical protein